MNKQLLSIFFAMVFIISIGGVFVGATGTFPDVDDSMVLYYHFNNQSAYGENDTYVYDFSGNGNNGTVTQAIFSPNNGYLFNGKYTFDGVDDYIQVDNSTNSLINSTNLRNGFSISVWLNPISLGESSVGKVVDKSTADGGANGFTLRFTSTNRLSFALNSNTSGNSNNNLVPFNTWTYITVTINSTGYVKYYKNGIQDGSGFQGSTSNDLSGITTTNAIRIGQRSIGTDRTYNGSIGSLIIFNKTLNSTEINSLFNLYNTFLVNDSFTFNNDTYNNAVTFLINSSNLILDCNSSIFYGNHIVNGISIINQTNITIKNCNLFNYDFSIYGYNVTNSLIRDNYLYNGTNSAGNIYFIESSNNNVFERNTILFGAKGIAIQGSSSISSGRTSINNTIMDNTINNVTLNGIDLFARASNNTVYRNNISYTGYVGIIINRLSNYNLIDSNYVFNLEEDGIQIRGYEDGTGNSTFNNVSNNVIINASYNCLNTSANCAQGILLNHYANNNNIINNTISGSNGNCIEPSASSTLNLIKGNIGSNCAGAGIELNVNNSAYIYNNVFDNPEKYAYVFNTGSFVLGFIGYPQFSNYLGIIPFSLTNNNLFNINANFTSLTSALLTNGTSLCNGSSSNLALNTGQINITLNPNDFCYVLNSFNLTEGVSRQYSPIWFSSTSTTSKHIASNLTNNIQTTIVFDVQDCSNIGNIKQTSPSGYTKLYQRGLFSSYTCSANRVTINDVRIEPSSESNEFTISYDCDSFTRLGYFLILIFTALAVVALCLVYISFRGGVFQMDMKDLFMMFMIIILGVIFWLTIGQTAGASCIVT